jgi:hypothetical protein
LCLVCGALDLRVLDGDVGCRGRFGRDAGVDDRNRFSAAFAALARGNVGIGFGAGAGRRAGRGLVVGIARFVIAGWRCFGGFRARDRNPGRGVNADIGVAGASTDLVVSPEERSTDALVDVSADAPAPTETPTPRPPPPNPPADAGMAISRPAAPTRKAAAAMRPADPMECRVSLRISFMQQLLASGVGTKDRPALRGQNVGSSRRFMPEGHIRGRAIASRI